jgi:catechol 2,3-dioxygenase-like lactoylglutathione lyase family enzyme
MSRIDHVAFETDDPDATAAFYERMFGARIVKTEGHPVMAYVGNTGFALHELGGPGPHTAVRVSEEERAELKRRLETEGIKWEERDHEIAVGAVYGADTEDVQASPARPSETTGRTDEEIVFAVGVFFDDPDGRRLEAITYRRGDDPRRPR